MAGGIGWILPNRHPYLVGRRRLLLRNSRGVRVMREEKRMKARPAMCGDCLTFLSDCAHGADYLQDLMTSAERLIQLAKEREELTK